MNPVEATPMDRSVKERLIQIVGEDGFSERLIDLVTYSYDASDNCSRPDGAVWPANTDQVSQILRLAGEMRFPVIPRGAGTGLAGSAVPVCGGLVMDLGRMNRILDIRIPDRLAVVQPGVVYADLQRALAPHGFFFPPDPASGKACTIGGNVATNAGGIRGAKYGVTRDYVLGLEVVLPDGRLMRTGSSCMKSVSGYDLTHLFVGSEGTLGVVTEITLKINPKPEKTRTGLARFASLDDAGRAVSAVMRSGILPSVLEILDENTLQILRDHGGMDVPEAKAILLVETDGHTDAETAAQMDRIVAVFRENHAAHIDAVDTQAGAEALWSMRKAVSSVSAQIRSHNVSEDVAVPISMVPDLLSGISGIVRRYGLPFVIFGHAGDGNLHPKIMYDGTDHDQARRVRAAVEEVFRLACKLGGTLTGEHGIGLSKAPFMALEHDPVEMGVMAEIKKLFDPKNILNPGKMGLTGPSRARGMA